MAITYGAGAGTTITSFALSETLGDQSQQTGNNQVVVSDDIVNATGSGGNIGNGTNGIGASYVGRLIVINRTGTQQRRMCIAETAGTGTTVILTVHEDWDTNPASSDTIDVPYEPADIEDGGAGNGIGLGAKTGFWELSNDLTVNASSGFQFMRGEALEGDDNGTGISVTVNGYVYSGYDKAGTPVNGGIAYNYKNSTGEPSWQFLSGSEAWLYDTFFWASLRAQQLECANGSNIYMNGTKMVSVSDELLLYDATLVNSSAFGRGSTTDICRVDAGTSMDGFVLSEFDTLDTVADTTTETIELAGVIFSGVTDYINVRNNKTWNMIDPVWDVTTYTDFVWVGSTSNSVNQRTSIKVMVQEADGTLLQNALVNVYENTQLADLVVEQTTDANGLAESSFLYQAHVTNSSTTTYGGHALQCGKWLYSPLTFTQSATMPFDGVITLSVDSHILQTTQATAKSDGSGITWNEDTNPSQIFGFDTGSGTVLVGMILTFSGGAVGTVTEIKDGDSTSGVLHLKDRNATAIGATDTFSRTGGTAGTFSGTCNATVNPVQSFSIWIDGQTLAVQTIYDYLSAIQTETTLTADGELIWEWCRDQQSQALHATGTSFHTERSYGKGVMLVDHGSGTVDYFTDDAGGTWTAPASVTVGVTVLDNTTGSGINLAHVLLYLDSDKSTQILNGATNASGFVSTPYSYTVDTDVVGWARQFDVVGTDYVQKDISGTINSSGLSLTVRLDPID